MRGTAKARHRRPAASVSAWALALLIAAGSWLSAVGAAAQDPPPEPGEVATPFIVEVAPGVEPSDVARELGVAPDFVYDTAIQGFAADLPKRAIRAAARSGKILRVTRDVPVRAAAQILPTGVNRIDADRYPQADIAGNGGSIDADIAVLDTGIARHPDLRVVGGVSCVGNGGTRPLDWNDGYGHGTSVAGTIAAKDDNQGVVGVAPGARLWAVKVLDNRGSGSLSSVICGLDWVFRMRRTIDVVNMSLEGPLPERTVDRCGSSVYHRAICQVSRQAGIPIAVAAGNGRQNAARVAPAAYPEVIAVSAFADFDGQPGRAASPRCRDRDDTFAGISNFGPVVDIAAPGVCIRTTLRTGGYGIETGTSMASPHVAGALALFAAANPRATERQARAWLLSDAASRPQTAPEGFTGDPDRSRERVLYLGPPPPPPPPPDPDPPLTDPETGAADGTEPTSPASPAGTP